MSASFAVCSKGHAIDVPNQELCVDKVLRSIPAVQQREMPLNFAGFCERNQGSFATRMQDDHRPDYTIFYENSNYLSSGQQFKEKYFSLLTFENKYSITIRMNVANGFSLANKKSFFI